MGFNVEFHVSVHGDIKISGGVFEWKNKKSMEVQSIVEYVFGSLGVYWIKKKNEMKWACGNMATMRSLCSGWLQNHVFLSVWMEKQKAEKLMEVQLPMEYVFASLGVYWIKKKNKTRSLCSGWLWNHVFLSVWMEKQKLEKSMEVQPAMEYVFGSLGVYWIKKKKIEMKWVCWKHGNHEEIE